MEIFLVAGGTLLLCWLVDKGFTKLFRSKPQHESGKSVRLNKRYASTGIVLCVLGCGAFFAGSAEQWLLWACGALMIVLGICFIAYYTTFGIFYDDDSFLLTSFGKKSTLYRYEDIEAQQLYNSHGNIVIELYMSDGRTVQLQSGMKDAYPFLDKAFAAWMRQKGKQESDCPFHDPDNSCWFPPVEG